MQPKGLLLIWAFTAAASRATADPAAAQQQVLMNDLPSSSETYEQKTSLAKTVLKVSSDGRASGIPEIAKLAIDISATSSVSQEDAVERLGLSILQVEFLLADQKAADIIDTYKGSSTHVSNAKENPHWNRGENNGDSAEEVKYRAKTYYNIRGNPGQTTEDIRSVMDRLREMPDVRVRGIEWELSETSRDQLRMEAKREALRKCLSHGEETAVMLGHTSGVMLMEVEETTLWVQEKQEMRRTVFYPARGEEINVRPREMEMSVKLLCKFGAP